MRLFFVCSSFIPPLSTKENAHQWYKQGYDIVDGIVHTRQGLLGELKQVIQNDLQLLEKGWNTIRVIPSIIHSWQMIRL